MAACVLPKDETRVRFSYSAQKSEVFLCGIVSKLFYSRTESNSGIIFFSVEKNDELVSPPERLFSRAGRPNMSDSECLSRGRFSYFVYTIVDLINKYVKI